MNNPITSIEIEAVIKKSPKKEKQNKTKSKNQQKERNHKDPSRNKWKRNERNNSKD